MEDWVTIRNLKKHNPKLGTRAIAKLLGVSRNTVKRALKGECYQNYQRKSTVSDELIPFYDFIKESYLFKKHKISVIIENLRSKGFKGSSSSIYRYINENFSEQREDLSRRTYLRFETAPAEQMQYDWTEYKVNVGESVVKVYFHCLIFSYSRYRVYDISLDKTQSSIFTVMEDAFNELGGVCKRIQVDNAAQFIVDAKVRHPQYNSAFLSFCGFYGITPTRSLPYHPWSKGKVESTFYYLREHFIKNNTFQSIKDLYIKLKEFQNTVNNKTHKGINDIPSELFKREREFLIELPHGSIKDKFKQIRKVTLDCLVSYRSNRYSVPYAFAGKTVWLLPHKGITLRIYSQKGNLIAEHPLSLKKGQIMINKAHYKNKIYDENSNYMKLSLLFKERFKDYENAEEFLQALKSQRMIQPKYHLAKIMDILSYYDNESCISVMEECFRYKNFTLNFIIALISKRKPKQETVLSNPNSLLNRYPNITEIKRNLKEYRLCQP
ncbi:IS21 family transposase [Thermodesulfovibrio yellowstonii]|nr:IS21 family transposase [Thermodesulfovibrio islandicus]